MCVHVRKSGRQEVINEVCGPPAVWSWPALHCGRRTVVAIRVCWRRGWPYKVNSTVTSAAGKCVLCNCLRHSHCTWNTEQSWNSVQFPLLPVNRQYLTSSLHCSSAGDIEMLFACRLELYAKCKWTRQVTGLAQPSHYDARRLLSGVSSFMIIDDVITIIIIS
jgi:hypothetical protein